ncbi:MAG: hypothetical protein RQ767_05240 [Thermovirgaceae bacterium]|nr:hypothetical protein [Thermovirgaceae bacterium]
MEGLKLSEKFLEQLLNEMAKANFAFRSEAGDLYLTINTVIFEGIGTAKSRVIFMNDRVEIMNISLPSSVTAGDSLTVNSPDFAVKVNLK